MKHGLPGHLNCHLRAKTQLLPCVIDLQVDDESNEEQEPWRLQEVSLLHQRVLVIAEVAWTPRARRGVYLVTWEVDGGGLKGNLFTDSTSVTLSLWPDTIYHIQVGTFFNYVHEFLFLNYLTKNAKKYFWRCFVNLILSVQICTVKISFNIWFP